MIDDEFPEPHMDEPIQSPIIGYLKMALDKEVEKRINELTDLVREIQFCDKNYFDHSDCCPVCGGDEEDGHKPDCRLNNLLTSR